MAAAAVDTQQLVKEITSPLFESKGWMKFLGVMLIIQGVFMVFTIIGIIIAWLPIWTGVVIYQAASGIEHAELTGEKERLLRAFGKLKLFFILNGVTVIAGLVLALLGGILGGMMEGAMMGS